MGKKSKEARRARRDADRASREAPVGSRDVADAQRSEAGFDASDRKIIRALQVCMPEIDQETAEVIMVELHKEEVQGSRCTHEAIVQTLQKAGHVNAVAMKDMVYKFLEDEAVSSAVYAIMDKGEVRDKAPGQEYAPQKEETVLVSKVKSRGTKAPGRKAHVEKNMGRQARGQEASQTLGLALSGKVRQPKPRKMGSIDEIVWAEARTKAVQEIKEDFKIEKTLDDYYTDMCSVGKKLLAEEVHRKTQKIYDYKATKMFQRKERKLIVK